MIECSVGHSCVSDFNKNLSEAKIEAEVAWLELPMQGGYIYIYVTYKIIIFLFLINNYQD